MPYEITAARKRPQGFGELAGQDFVSATLEASLSSGRIAHAYLFSGPRGCGKTSTARILAKALNCEKGPTSTPCGVCSSCKAIAAGSSLDVIEIDGASNTSVDNVRQIKDEVLFPPNGGRYKVYIIDEVHMLSMSAFNALLKTIEEPPPYVVFIFATTELHKVPATIKSRCQQFAFRLVPFETLKGLLSTAAKELGVEADDDALLWIAKEAGGSPRDAYTLFDQVVAFSEGRITYAKIRDKLGLVGLDAMNGLFESLVCPDAASAPAKGAHDGFEALDAILSRGVSPEQVVLDAVEYCRALLLLKNGIDRESLLGASPEAYSPRVLAALGSEQIERALGELLDLYRDIRFTVDPRFELELATARLARLPSYVPVTELARTVASLKKRLTSGARPASQSQEPAAELPPPRHDDVAGLEKKKPELPTSLKSAFSSLAATVGQGRLDDGDSEGEGEPSEAAPIQKQAATPPRPSAPPASPSPSASPPPIVPAATSAAQRVPPRASAMEDSGLEPEDGEDAEEDEAWTPPQPRQAGGNEGGSPQGGALAARDGRGDASAADPSSDDPEAVRRAVLDCIGRASPLLSTGLSASLPWIIEEGRIVIPFRSGMEESVVKSELPSVAQAISKARGRACKVELRVAQAKPTRNSATSGPEGQHDAADIVASVFRGQRIQPKPTGGKDGL
jgi:DNA polymerase-3 subunit gamma/tau